MKLLHSLALLAVFLLVADTVAPTNAWSIFSKTESKSETEVKTKEAQIQRDEEGNDADDERVNDLDGDYREPEAVANKPAEAMPYSGLGEEKTKIQIQDELEDLPAHDAIPVIHELPSQGGQVNATHYDSNGYPYNRDPQQSEFLDRTHPHPTESNEMDPRFANRPQCQDGQYLCRKQTPQQAHVRCIPNEWKCNGVRDCEENDDEEGCSVQPHRPSPNQCISPYQYTCHGTGINGIPIICIDANKVCDGNYDCTYGDDEQSDRCGQRATRREETVVQPSPQEGQQVQHSPQYNHYNGQQQPQQPQPQQQPAPQPPQQCNGGKSDEYVKRLEWIDRCFRSCLKN